jgi:dipeptidyl aminopeptidase/acylaminoacyl peptidase
MNMKVLSILFVLFIVLAAAPEIKAQRLNLEKVVEALEKSECVTVSAGKIKICKYDFDFEGKKIEAIFTLPTSVTSIADGSPTDTAGSKLPGILLAPGFDLTAVDLIPLGTMFAHEGFASVAITPPGFGKSQGKSDFVGPGTVRAFMAGWNKFKQEAFVNADKMAIYGHSRGGMASALLAIEVGKEARAAVMASGIYDFERAANEVQFRGIRERMIVETDMNETAFKERSAILRLNELKIPVLIMHGEKDDKISVTQAYLMRDKLTALKKDFELKIYPDTGHALNPNDVVSTVVNFLRKKMNINHKGMQIEHSGILKQQ